MPLTGIERAIIESQYWNGLRAREVRTLVKNLDCTDKKFLNIGAGRTNLTHALLGQSAGNITNVDIEPFQNLDRVASATDLPFENGAFDITVFLRVLHHVNDFQKALAEALRCTKPGGCILISEPYDWMIKLIRATGLDSHPSNLITQHDIERFVRDNQLHIRQKWARIFFFYYGYQIQVP